MKKIFTLSILFFVLIITAQAQKFDGSIKGKLTDTLAKLPVPDATISVLNAKDSSLVTFTLSTKLGAFEVKGLGEGDYRLVISSKGFVEFKKTVSITATEKTIDLGSLAV
jgi:Carboxypeptidase regulatory-like domain